MIHLWPSIRMLYKELPLRWLVAVLAAGTIGLTAGHRFLSSVCVVSGPSMSPSFPPGAFLFTKPVMDPLERGDVVLVNDGHEDLALKRIVGLPGETVHLWRGKVFINRQALNEPYVPRNVYTFARGRLGASILGQEQYFLLGDNRLNSTDSRTYGPVEVSQIKRLVSVPRNAPRASFEPYMLPDFGEFLPRRLVTKADTVSAF